MVCSRVKSGQDLLLCVYSQNPKMVQKKLLVKGENYYQSKLIIKIIEIKHKPSFFLFFSLILLINR